MKKFRVSARLCALFVLAWSLVPSVVAAGLLGDTVGATLTNPATSVNAFSGTATVVTNPPPPIEFMGTFPAQGGNDTSTWGLDVRDNGFRLDGSCPLTSQDLGCDFPQGLILTLSDLDFTPPASLVNLTGSGSLHIDGTPLITSDSVTITFQAFTLVTDGNPAMTSFEAVFVTRPVIATPQPATLFLVLLGTAGLAIVGVGRILS